MKEEIMKVLSLLENGVINADEADKLIRTLNGEAKAEKDERIEKAASNLSEKFAKLGDGIEKFAKTVGEKAEKAVEEAKPIVKKVGERAGEVAEDIADKAKNINLNKNKADDIIDAEENETVKADDDDDFVKDEKIIIMPEAESFSSNGTEEVKDKE